MEPKDRDVNLFPFRGYATYPPNTEYCEDLINMELVGDQFQARRGYEEISVAGLDATQTIQGVHLWAEGFGICVDGGGGAYKIAEATMFAGGTWTPIGSGLIPAFDSAPHFFEAAFATTSSPILIMCLAANEAQQFCFGGDQTHTLANLTMRQLGSTMSGVNPYGGCIYGARVLLYGIGGNVYYSDTSDPFKTYLNNVKAIGDLSEAVISVIPSNRGALIFKRNSIWAVTGADFATASPSFLMDAPVMGRRAICRDKRGTIYFACGRSIMRWGSPSEELSKNLEEIYETTTTSSSPWLGYIWDKDQLLYMSQDSTRQADAFAFDLAKGGISKVNNYPFTGLHTVMSQDRIYPTATLAGGAAATSKIYRIHDKTVYDVSSNISSLIQTKLDAYGSPMTEKTPRGLSLWGNSSSPVYVDLVYRDKDYNQHTVGITSSYLPAEISLSPNLRNSSGNPINFVEASVKLYGQEFNSLKNIRFFFKEQRPIFKR